jgi:hypothetical protein
MATPAAISRPSVDGCGDQAAVPGLRRTHR